MHPRIATGIRPRPAVGRLVLPVRLGGVSIHRRLALGRFGDRGAGIRRRGDIWPRRLDINDRSRPAEIIGPSARRRQRPAFDERAGDGCSGNSSRNGIGPEQLFRRNLRLRERHHRPGCRPWCRTVRFAFRRLRVRAGGHRERDWHALIADDAFDFALDVMGELARTELRKIDAVAAP